jgi:hypothetical protein
LGRGTGDRNWGEELRSGTGDRKRGEEMGRKLGRGGEDNLGGQLKSETGEGSWRENLRVNWVEELAGRPFG